MSADLLRTLLARPVAFHPCLARCAGSAAAGLFMSQLLYWSDKGKNEDGWIWKDAREWESETCLTADEQKTARKKLRDAGLIEESNLRALGINKFSTTNAFRINFEALQNAINGLQTRVVIGEPEIPARGIENPCPESRKPLPGKPETPAQYTETTAHTTSQTTTTARAAAGDVRGGGEKNQTPKSKTPAPPAPADGVGKGDADEAREGAGQGEQPDALHEISVADSCQQFQAALASAAIAAGLDRIGTQKLADALAGSLAAPAGDPGCLKNRNNPAGWLASTAKAIAAGGFVDGTAYLAAVAARQAKQAARRVASGEEDAEHRRRLEAAAAAIKIDPEVLALGCKLMPRRGERRA